MGSVSGAVKGGQSSIHLKGHPDIVPASPGAPVCPPRRDGHAAAGNRPPHQRTRPSPSVRAALVVASTLTLVAGCRGEEWRERRGSGRGDRRAVVGRASGAARTQAPAGRTLGGRPQVLGGVGAPRAPRLRAGEE